MRQMTADFILRTKEQKIHFQDLGCACRDVCVQRPRNVPRSQKSPQPQGKAVVGKVISSVSYGSGDLLKHLLSAYDVESARQAVEAFARLDIGLKLRKSIKEWAVKKAPRIKK